MLSVCIVNWNTRTYLRECLASLEAFPPADGAMEVVVVDNASSDGSADMVRDEFPETVLIRADSNLGYAEGNNAALSRASGEWLLLLNPDVRVGDGALSAAIEFARARPDAAAVSVRFRNPDGTQQPSVRGFPSPEALFWEVLGLRRLFRRNRRFGAYFMPWFDYAQPAEVDQPMGTFLLMSRAAYEAVGALDTQFPIFFNEVDWCLRAKSAGWKIYYTPGGEIVHYGGRGTRRASKRKMIIESHRSLEKFYAKHYRERLGPRRLAFAIAAIRLAGYARAATGRA